MRSPTCALVVGWEGEQTLQYEGTAERTISRADNPQLAAYFDQYPDGRDRLAWAGIAHFIITPVWMRYSDYAQNPPYFEVWP